MDKRIVTSTGDEMIQAPDGAGLPREEGWFSPTANPFLHGCCDCGLAHKVEFTVVDSDGVEQIFPSHLRLALRFSREEGATEKIRRRKVNEWAATPKHKAVKNTKMLRAFLEESVVPLPTVMTKETAAVERFLFESVTSGQVAGTDFSGVPITSMTRDGLLSLVALLAAGKPEEKEESSIILLGGRG
jgi:hypothetical protein